MGDEGGEGRRRGLRRRWRRSGSSWSMSAPAGRSSGTPLPLLPPGPVRAPHHRPFLGGRRRREGGGRRSGQVDLQARRCSRSAVVEESVGVKWDTCVCVRWFFMSYVCARGLLCRSAPVAGLNYLVYCLEGGDTCGCCDTSLSLSLPTPVPCSCVVWESVTVRGETVV